MQKLISLLFLLALPWISIAQQFVANYDEAKVPVFTLPDVLVFNNGTRVATKKDWDKRRSEIYSIFETDVFGVVPELRRWINLFSYFESVGIWIA